MYAVARAAPFVTLVLFTACSASAPAAPDRGAPDAEFALRVGESTRIAGAPLVVGFDGVRADSRCPKGERCVWAGDAIVRVWLQRPGEPKTPLELHTATNARPADTAASGLRVVRLEPVPISGKPIAPADYVVTLAIDGEPSSTAPER
jgi:hypothetical protein